MRNDGWMPFTRIFEKQNFWFLVWNGWPACNHSLSTRACKPKIFLGETFYITCYNGNIPLTVLQSWFNITWASDVTIKVASWPPVPCTITEAPSLSRHWATRQAAFNVFWMCDNQWLHLESHFSEVKFWSLQA